MNFESSPAFQELDLRFSQSLKGHLVGRRIRARLLRIAIEVAPDCNLDSDGARKMLKDRIKSRLYGEYGNPLLIMILIPLITELVKILIAWWLERQENRDVMKAWQDASQG